MRLLVLKEDYCGSLLTMSDCENEELKQILERAEINAENNVGQTLTEICKELFPDKFRLEIGCTDERDYERITELGAEPIIWTDTLTFFVVQGELF